MKFLLSFFMILIQLSLVAETKLIIISKVNDSNFSDQSKLASVNDDLKMSFVVSKIVNGNRRYYSEIKNIELNNTLISHDNIYSLNDLSDDFNVIWYKIEEKNGEHYNNCSPNWHWEEIPYKATRVQQWNNLKIVNPNVIPTIFTPVYCNNKITGTMRFKVSISLNGKKYETEGVNSKYKGSISEKVHRISLKGNTGNKVIDNAFSMCNLPYIWGSANFSKSYDWDNQAERFIGADCADFAVAAHQLAGNKIPYDTIKNLSHTKIINTVIYIRKGNYLDANKAVIKVGPTGVEIGDFVYWNYNKPGAGHVALFLEDKSDPKGKYKGKPDGLFNQWDLVIHTLFHEPEVKSVGEAYSGGIRIFRYTEND